MLGLAENNERGSDTVANDSPGMIGKGIQIRGTLSGSEDLIVEGRVEGKINLKEHLTIEQSGIVVADIDTDELTVWGQLSGNVEAVSRAEIKSSSVVVGDIRAPKIVIEDGARFRGNIEMDVKLPPNI
jgi:cytoskeletal protein CcmA (bactofilin family)